MTKTTVVPIRGAERALGCTVVSSRESREGNSWICNNSTSSSHTVYEVRLFQCRDMISNATLHLFGAVRHLRREASPDTAARRARENLTYDAHGRVVPIA